MPEAPHLVTRPHAEVGIENPPVAFRGRFSYEKIHARTGIVTERGAFDNLITDVGLNALGGTRVSDLASHIAVGTGSNAPAFTDIQLQNEIGRTSADGGFADASGYDATDPARPFYWFRKVFLFTETQANGNLTELGTFNTSSAGILWNRQLFRDANGNPTVITKTNDEQLKLFYEWRVYPPTAAATQVIHVNGTDVTVTNRAYSTEGAGGPSHWGSGGVLRHFGQWQVYAQLYESNTMPSFSGGQSGTYYPPNAFTTAAYVNNSLYRDGELRWDPANANAPTGLLGSMVLYYSNSYNPPFISTFTPRLAKTANDRVIIQTRISWARATV